MAQAKLTGSPHFFLYTIPYIYIECTSQGLVVFDYNRVKDFKQASLSSSSSPSHRHLGIKLQAKKFTCNADEQRKWKIGAQLTMLPFTPLIFRPFNFPRRESVSRYPGSSLVRFPQPNRIQKAFEAERNKVNIWLIRFLAMIVQTQFLLIFNTQGLRLGIAARNKNTTQQPIINHQ